METLPERKRDLNGSIAIQLRPCLKRPIIVSALQCQDSFRVRTIEGDYKQGKKGDYLMCGVDDELYICDKTIFEKSYDFVDPPKEDK